MSHSHDVAGESEIEELCKRLERVMAGRPETLDNDLPTNPDGQEAASVIRRLVAERDEARRAEKALSDELDICEQEGVEVDNDIMQASARADAAESQCQKWAETASRQAERIDALKAEGERLRAERDWPVSALELAERIMTKLGHAPDASKEPGADRRRDNICALVGTVVDRATAAEAEVERLRAERDEALEERDIWRSVFPDIAPESVVPDRSLLESRATAAEAEVERLRAALYLISCPTQTKNLLWWQIEARTALEGKSDE